MEKTEAKNEKNDKPEYPQGYQKWLKGTLGCESGQRMENYYQTVTNKVLNSFGTSTIWQEIIKNLQNINQRYYLDTNYYLLISPDQPSLSYKPYVSYINKTYRRNISQNPNWPEPPNNGWINPQKDFDKINDIIRTCFVVKYLDGVKYLVDEIKRKCDQNNHKFKIDYEAKEEGYYAAHFYIEYNCEIIDTEWKPLLRTFSIELQITTQLQEVIRRLLHTYYEKQRMLLTASEDYKWQWDYKSEEFSANYLGHILHYLEGMILEVRNKQAEKGASS